LRYPYHNYTQVPPCYSRSPQEDLESLWSNQLEMNRRTFLLSSSALLMGVGCSKPAESLKLNLVRLSPVDGRVDRQLALEIPSGRWKALTGNGSGFLYGNAYGLLAVEPETGNSYTLMGPTDGLWVRPEQLIATQKISGEVMQISSHPIQGGAPSWKFEAGYASWMGYADESLYVAHPQGVACYDLGSGQRRWNNPDLTDLKSGFVAPNWLLMGLGNAGRMAWVDRKSGKVLRSLTTDRLNRNIVVAGDAEYSVCLTRRIAFLGFAGEQEKIAWKIPVSSDIHESQVLAMDGPLVLVELDHNLCVLDFHRGKILWTCPHYVRATASKGVLLLQRAAVNPTGVAKVSLEARRWSDGKEIWKKTSDWPATAALGVGPWLHVLGQNFVESR